METLVSSWSNPQILPDNYIFPEDIRPGNQIVAISESVPVIDLANINGIDRSNLIKKVLKACQDFGFFQVVNHGVSEELLLNTMKLFDEFFSTPVEDRTVVYSDDPRKSCRLYTSHSYANEKVHLWRDVLTHPCLPLDECKQLWPEKPTRYREIVESYSVEVRKVSLRILELICEGLGLEEGYFEDELTKGQLMSVNHYPPCPDPSLTLGLLKHCDPNLITILQQGDVYGLQVFKESQWIGVQPVPSALVINIGYQLQIISNGILKSVEHRAVTNSDGARTTIVTFISPFHDTMIMPATSLVTELNPPLYDAFRYKDFLANYIKNNAQSENSLDPYKLQN